MKPENYSIIPPQKIPVNYSLVFPKIANILHFSILCNNIHIGLNLTILGIKA